MSLDQKSNALKKVWWVERDGIGIATASSTDETSDFVSVSEVKTVNVHAIKHDKNFIESGSPGYIMTQSPAIPDEFHEGLVNYAIAKGYELNPEKLQAASYFRQLWNMCVNEGKQFSNQERLGNQGYTIRQQDF